MTLSEYSSALKYGGSRWKCHVRSSAKVERTFRPDFRDGANPQVGYFFRRPFEPKQGLNDLALSDLVALDIASGKREKTTLDLSQPGLGYFLWRHITSSAFSPRSNTSDYE